jgi:hypothetical protein
MEAIETKEKILERGMSNPQSPYLLSIKQAAKKVGLSTWAMRTRVWRGEIEVVRFEGERKQYIDSRDLLKLIERNKHRCE